MGAAVFGKVGQRRSAEEFAEAYDVPSESWDERDAMLKVLAAVGFGDAYKAGRVTPQTQNWLPPHRSGDSAMAGSWDIMTPRIRDLVKNDPGIRKASLSLRRLIIGTGVRTFSAAKDAARILFPDDPALHENATRYEEETDFLFNEWAENEADAVHRRSLWELQSIAFKEATDTGNALFLICNSSDPTRSVPFCLQVIEAEQLDRSKDRSGGEGVNPIIAGIEYDWKTKRPVAYHLYDAHPYDEYQGGVSHASARVDASRVIHWFPVVDQASANSGVSWFVAMALASRDIDWYLGNELTAAAIAALFTVVYNAENPYKKIAGLREVDSSELEKFGPPPVQMGNANIATIGLKEKLDVIQSNRPNANVSPFISLMSLREAMSIDLSYIRLTGDLKATSYTAARAAHLEDDGMVKPLQNSFALTVCAQIRKLWQSQAVAIGDVRSVSLRDYRRHRRILQNFDHLPVGREQLDPAGETESSIAKLRSGQSTLKIECGKRQLHYKSVLRQLGDEMKLAGDCGVILDFGKGNGGNVQTEGQAKPADDNNTEEGD